MTDNDDEIEQYGRGWAWLKGGGKPDDWGPPEDPEKCTEWIAGFCAVLADIDLEPWQEWWSIEAALVAHGITGERLKTCLTAAEEILAGDEWHRWPNVPTRAARCAACGGTGLDPAPGFEGLRCQPCGGTGIDNNPPAGHKYDDDDQLE